MQRASKRATCICKVALKMLVAPTFRVDILVGGVDVAGERKPYHATQA